MDHIRVIQEVVDAHKEDMPTGVTTRVMEECQKAYNELPALYKLTWTMVNAHAHVEHVEDEEDFAHVKLVPKTQTLIVEAVEHLPDHPEHGSPSKMNSIDMPHHGMVLASWIKLSMPLVIKDSYIPSKLVVIHSILPYEARKRQRDD